MKMKITSKIFSFAIMLAAVFYCGTDNTLMAEQAFIVHKGDGIAQTYSNEADARRLALEDAIKNSVIEAVKTFIPDSVVEEKMEKLEKQIFSKADIYVASYRVTYRGWITRLDVLKDKEPADNGDDGEVNPDSPGGEAKEGEGDVLTESLDPSTDMVSELDDEVEEGFEEEAEEEADQSYLFRDEYKEGVDEFHLGIEAKIFIRQLKEDALKVAGVKEDEDLRVVNILIVEIADYLMFQRIVDSLESLGMVRDLEYKSFEYERITLDVRIAEKIKIFQKGLRDSLGDDYTIIVGDEDMVIVKPAS